MKKITVFALCFAMPGVAGAYIAPVNSCGNAFSYELCQPNGAYQVDQTCIDYCNDWKSQRDSPLRTTNGLVVTTAWPMLTVEVCPDSGDYDTAVECWYGSDTFNTYQCAAGYYGTPGGASDSSACTVCPGHGTCDGGDTFACERGYYKSGGNCNTCPSLGGVAGTTVAANATSITQCYLPAASQFSENSGQGTYTANCFYTN